MFHFFSCTEKLMNAKNETRKQSNSKFSAEHTPLYTRKIHLEITKKTLFLSEILFSSCTEKLMYAGKRLENSISDTSRQIIFQTIPGPH